MSTRTTRFYAIAVLVLFMTGFVIVLVSNGRMSSIPKESLNDIGMERPSERMNETVGSLPERFVNSTDNPLTSDVLMRILHGTKSVRLTYKIDATEYCLFSVASTSIQSDRRDAIDDNLSSRIVNYIQRNPGSHLRDIKRNLNCGVGSLQYQLTQLEDDGVIHSIVKGNSKHFFTGDFAQDDSILLIFAHARNPVVHSIICECLDNSLITKAELSRVIGVDISVVSYYVNILLQEDILEPIRVFGREKPVQVSHWAIESINHVDSV